MKKKDSLKTRQAHVFVKISLAILLLVALALIANNLFASYMPRTNYLQPPPSTPPVHTQSESQPYSTSEWQVYYDPIIEVRFKFPEGWEITEAKHGEYARFINSTSQRIIEFVVDDNPTDLSPSNFIMQRLQQVPIPEISSSIQVESAPGLANESNISSVWVSEFPEGLTNLQDIIVFDHQEKGKLLRFTLLEGGEIGGVIPSNSPSIYEDEQIFLQIVNTVEIEITSSQ